MKTRYSSLVTVKKNVMQKSERAVQSANATLNNAQIALQLSRDTLPQLSSPTQGSMSEMLASRALIDVQHAEIEHNKEWVAFATSQVEAAKEQLKRDMIEYEKYKYLEYQEQQKIQKAQQRKEAKDLDEVALITFAQKHEKVS